MKNLNGEIQTLPIIEHLEILELACTSLVGCQECIIEAVISVRSCLILKNSIGYCYCHGIGVEKDKHKASIL
ncbi:hypothetical protein C2G38_2232578 [Gigaspora rosea]|uniref:Uncharacterized protein n=1 Tax=Gigaspora rosea TaxID=44941 RepID=A0A397TRV1_9GLOM|nr:hypothetical protein C2G38_2232578 [Gigaspora rosea]